MYCAIKPFMQNNVVVIQIGSDNYASEEVWSYENG